VLALSVFHSIGYDCILLTHSKPYRLFKVFAWGEKYKSRPGLCLSSFNYLWATRRVCIWSWLTAKPGH